MDSAAAQRQACPTQKQARRCSRHASARASQTAIQHYLQELAQLEISLSMSVRMAKVTTDLTALAERNAQDQRDDEP